MLIDQSQITPKNLAISIVSHGHGQKVKQVLKDLEPLILNGAQVLLTLNIPEDEKFLDELKIKPELIRNPHKKGFGENHNNAFMRVNRPWFAVINPDTRIDLKIFNCLDKAWQTDDVGVIGPLVVDNSGVIESSARYYPTLQLVIKRLLKRIICFKLIPDYDTGSNDAIIVDWVSGCFMLFNTQAYDLIGGYDTQYFMYLEDADICFRLKLAGFKVLYYPKATIIHQGQYASRSNLKHLYWHLISMLRFLWVTRKIKWN